MKRTILVMGTIMSIFTVTSCLENEEMDFVPAAEQESNVSYYGKDGSKDSADVNMKDSATAKPPTGGQQGQNPVKP